MSSAYEWDYWLDEAGTKSDNTVGVESRIVVYGSVPQPIIVRGVTVWVYDTELALMVIKGWAESGMPRSSIEQLLLERIPT